MVSKQPDREELKRRYRELITAQLYAALWRQAARLTLCREDAEDLLQDTLVTAYRKLGQLKDSSKARPWVFAILRRRFFNQVRTTRRRLSGEERVRSEPTMGDAVEHVVVQAALYALPPDKQWLLTAHYIEDVATTELAEVLGTSQANVRQRLHRARRALRDELKRMQVDDLQGYGT